MEFKHFQIKVTPARGKIYSAIELPDHIDFDVKRIYFVQGSTGPTGAHCHYEEKELFIMAEGTATALIDRGNGTEEFHLDAMAGDALYVPNYVWHQFKDYSDEHALLLCISSTRYREDRSDTLEDYDAYLKIRDEKLKP